MRPLCDRKAIQDFLFPRIARNESSSNLSSALIGSYLSSSSESSDSGFRLRSSSSTRTRLDLDDRFV
eukprot:7761809-Karenia_brevis.AAC.1